MGLLIRNPFNAFEEVEKRLKHRFWDKQRERSNRAAGIAEAARGTKRRCPSMPAHAKFSYSGPPDDPIKAYVCIYCGAAACEPEIKERGFDFELCPDWIMLDIMNQDLQRQAAGTPAFFGGLGGMGELDDRK